MSLLQCVSYLSDDILPLYRMLSGGTAVYSEGYIRQCVIVLRLPDTTFERVVHLFGVDEKSPIVGMDGKKRQTPAVYSGKI